MRLENIGGVVEEACALLGPGLEADRLRALLRECYRPERTLAEATRRFAHALFGRYGLVIIDGDDPVLKRLFAPIMREELLNGIAKRAVDHADGRLAERYAPQAHARAINLFHLREGHRSRIDAEAGHYQVLNGGPRYTLEELLQDVEEHPQDYSPNVLLRPLYQETVLPNIAYIGGGGELAYWMQLRWLFQAVRVPMPVVLLRTSAALVSAKAGQLRAAIGLTHEDLFAPAAELRTRVARAAFKGSAALDAERAGLAALLGNARDKARAIDPTLQASAAATEARMMRLLDGLQARMDRALRRREAVSLDRLDRVLSELFPAGGLQERRLNMLPMLALRGPALLDQWLEALDPMDPRFTLLLDE
jgi:bacillithiol biosynthesis cysteine-adding enzyme BshC